MPLDLDAKGKFFKNFMFPLDLDLQAEIDLLIWIGVQLVIRHRLFPLFCKERETHTHTLSESTTITICPQFLKICVLYCWFRF